MQSNCLREIRGLGQWFVFMAFALWVISSGLGCSGGSSDNWDTVAGTVIERDSRLPIDSAWVSFHDSIPDGWFTDSLGRFGRDILPFTQIDVFAGKLGYRTAHQIIESSNGGVLGLVLELEEIGQSAGEE